MPKRMHYTQDEWLLLGKAPVQVGMAVMGSGETSPFQLVRELIGIGQALRETSQTSGATALIIELNVETQAQLSELSQQQTGLIDFVQIRAQIADMCRKVAAIVDAKESAIAAQEYKRWLLWIGRRVAAAAPEDANSPVSADEAELLNVIATALGLEQDRGAASATPAPTEAIPSAALLPEQPDEAMNAAPEGAAGDDATPATSEQT